MSTCIYRKNFYRTLLAISACLILTPQYHVASQDFTFGEIAISDGLTTSASTLNDRQGDGFENREKEIGVLLFKNGFLVEGKITLNKNLYTVEGKFKTTIPTHKIEYAGTDRLDVYNYMKSKPAAASYDGAVALGKWCLSRSMPDEALTEFERAKTYTNYTHIAKDLDREIAAATQLKLKLQQTLKNPAPQTSSTSDTNVKNAAAPPEADFLYTAVTSSVLEQFKKDVQPFLLNRCAAADCHGTKSSQEFKLVTPMREFSTTEATKRNLSEVFKRLNFNDIPASPIIQMPLKEHGGAKKIYTQQSKKQFDALYKWSQSIPNIMPDYVAEINKLKSRKTGVESSQITDDTPQRPVRESPLGTATQAGFNGVKPLQSPTKMMSNSQISRMSHESGRDEIMQAFLNEIDATQQEVNLPKNSPGFQFDDTPKIERKSESKPTDPFDPKAFNEKYH